MADKEYSEEIKHSLKTLVDLFDREDDQSRQRQIRQWKRLMYMWSGITKMWWSETAHDWRIFDDATEGSDDQSYYDKTINVFRAYLESIIAAMSATVPGVKCKPDDANNVNDVLTAKGGTKISELIYSHNDAPLLWSKALFIYCTQGMIAAYNYTDKSREYGLINSADYKDVEEKQQSYNCPKCQKSLDSLNIMAAIEKELIEDDEYDPGEDDVDLHTLISNDKIICEECQQEIDPELKEEVITVTRMVGMTQKPKARQIIEVEGGLFVKVPNYARCQKECPYLEYAYETHVSFVYAKYPKLRKENKDVTSESDSSGNNLYARWGRLAPAYYGEYPSNTPTVRNWWLRPDSFESLGDENRVKELKEKFPDGCKVVFINEQFAEACNESLDDHWTLTYNPLSEFIHFDPLGLLLTSIQEITNDLVSLTVQTIEQGIPQTFVDPTVVNLKAYREAEVMPGAIYGAKPKSGKALSDSFYEVKTAQLSQEVGPFATQIQEMGQLVSGAMPSLFGGSQANSSRTASQYAMSRAQSLQRLQTPWKMLTFWWKNIFGKVIPAYIKDMKDDERIVKQMGNNWLNVIIKKSEMDGKIGEVELEAADDLPMTTAQVRDLVMQLFNLNNPKIMEIIGSPANLPLLQTTFGLNDLHLPGEDDREKQLEEIQELMNAAPTMGMGQPDPVTGQAQPQPESSIQPELMVDSHDIEAEICRIWLVSEAGRQAKVDNNEGYQNVLLHMKTHIMMMQQLQQMMGGGDNQPPSQNSNPSKKPGTTVSGPTTQNEKPQGNGSGVGVKS
jgi:hypothetical protein